MGYFKAGVQYGDWEGTAAADNADNQDLADYLENIGRYDPTTEFLISASLYVGENNGGQLGGTYIVAYVLDAVGAQAAQQVIANTPDPLPVRCIRIEISLEEFVALFKRFSVMLTKRGLQLEDREYQCLPTDDED
ncbi:hypothetical protein [Kiloniella sp.]|uniref:hypothetical protein n=1 Tax=Kiloniella sp. TaxID=1938587 RepID=UPI003B01B525